MDEGQALELDASTTFTKLHGRSTYTQKERICKVIAD